jgi:CubicO group peptidase (beta-lactamase class C family)
MRRLVSFVLALAPFGALRSQVAPPQVVAAVDSVFASWTNGATPGCAVGVAHGGNTVLTRAYGMANLEYDVPITATTIFEAGSVSKQFTAAAVGLLVLDGKLSLEDRLRKFFPELPAWADSITIRQMLNHTSGLRDWGTVVGAAGWPRGTRTYTHTHVLDVIGRQRSLNYRPGDEYLYSNSNYNLAAMLVERLSGMKLAEFTKRRLFDPLGMTSTSWRDDYARIVKNRSTAYSGNPNAGWRQDMPFENVYGNSSLLTTVGDLLKWNRHLSAASTAPALAELLHQRGKLNNGRTISYALGIEVDEYRGVPQVSHTGATAGYRAYLSHFPRQDLDVALLCNAGAVNPGAIGNRVAEVFLRPDLGPAPRLASAAVTLSPEQLQARSGTWRQVRTGTAIRLTARDGALRWGNTALVPMTASTFSVGFDNRMEFLSANELRVVDAAGDTLMYAREPDWTPSAAERTAYAGRYESEEAEASFTVTDKDGQLTIADRYGRSSVMTPLYRDAFTSGGMLVTFHRSASGSVVAASLGLGRVRDLRFERR